MDLLGVGPSGGQIWTFWGSDTVLIVNLLIHWCTIPLTAFVDRMGDEQELPCRGNPRHLFRLAPPLQSTVDPVHCGIESRR